MKRLVLGAVAATAALAACGATAPDYAAIARTSQPIGHVAAAATPYDWPEFGLNPQRTSATDAATGITATNVAQLHRHAVLLPGTVDSSPIFLHGVSVAGATRDVFIVETTYGHVLAIDASSGTIEWDFTPPGIASWQGTYQFSTATPISDRTWVYSTSPNGDVHKLSVATGQEAAGWPVRITLSPQREKLTASLNFAGSTLLASTGGYIGDSPPYQGHLVAIDRSSGHITAVFNTLCANRRQLIVPSSCPASDSAILSRSGPVVEPDGTHVLIATGNGPYNGTTNFGDSVLELGLPSLSLRRWFTPSNQATLNSSDTDLGSSDPALLPGNLLLEGGKDGLLRLLDLSKLHSGQLQTVTGPGGAQLFSEPTPWHSMVFVANDGGTAAYTVSHRRLHLAWQNGTAGTTPVVAGGLLYIYDPNNGGLVVYHPTSGRKITRLPSGSGHWNSPIVVAGKIALPEGNANSDATQGVLDIYS